MIRERGSVSLMLDLSVLLSMQKQINTLYILGGTKKKTDTWPGHPFVHVEHPIPKAWHSYSVIKILARSGTGDGHGWLECIQHSCLSRICLVGLRTDCAGCLSAIKLTLANCDFTDRLFSQGHRNAGARSGIFIPVKADHRTKTFNDNDVYPALWQKFGEAVLVRRPHIFGQAVYSWHAHTAV